MNTFEKNISDLEHTKTELLEQVRRIEYAIAVLRGQSNGAVSMALPFATFPPEVPPDRARPFTGLTVVDAAKRYLTTVEKASAPEIANALLAGGFETGAKDFKRTVYSLLYRAWQENEIAKEGGAFSLPRERTTASARPA